LTAVPPEVNLRGFAPGRATLKICALSSFIGSMKRWKAIGPGFPGKVASAAGAKLTTPTATAAATKERGGREMRAVRVIASSL
jgi:hypothetical protein